MLFFAIAFITLALVFYSIGVWSEKLAGSLRGWHLAFFWLGFACDTTGTSLMENMAGGWNFGFHSITGALAIILMLVHAVWGSIVLARKDAKTAAVFHKFSLAVWLVWLVPYLSGVIVGMARH
jgi:uncharacterized repeat protein (TIGR03987 family)